MDAPKKPLVLYALGIFAVVMLLLLGARMFGSAELGGPENSVPIAPSTSPRVPADLRLAETKDLPPPTIDGAQKSEDLARRYPLDARVRLLRFLYFVGRQEYDAAQGEIDAALAAEDILNKAIPDAGLKNRFVFASFLNDRGQVDEARAIAWPVCTGTQGKLAPLRQKLREAALCSGS